MTGQDSETARSGQLPNALAGRPKFREIAPRDGYQSGEVPNAQIRVSSS
jgi:hypothetical protein